jgi:signal transduction histidine kinase
MKPRIKSSAFLRPRNMMFIALVAVGLALLEVFIDAVTWVELDVAAIYGLPLVLAALTRSRRLLWLLTAALTIATFAVYAVQIPGGAFALNETFFVNRLFDAVAVLLTAGLLHVWIISVDTAEAQAQLLKTQNDELEAANVELMRHEEKIAHQNEELERRRREAEEASARKTQFLTSVSHDIRTPVNTINLMAEVIRRTAENPALAAQLPKLAQRLQANALSLADLLSTVLDTARLESGRVEYQESMFSLNALLASSCEDLLPAAQAKTLQVQIELPERTIWLRTDRIKLQRVISNLVSNAIKFTDHGTVTVTAALTADRDAVICVQDTGIGIAPQQLERIFTEFAQAGNASSSGNSGWGLGLSICRRLITLIGGRITVESELNQGSVFKVRLPPECVVDEPEGEPPVALQMKLKSYP